MGDREIPVVFLPALACPACGAWDSRADGKRWLKVTWTDRISETRQQSVICRKCGARFQVMTSPKIRQVALA